LVTSENRGKRPPLYPPLTPISKPPQFHNSDLENLPTLQLLRSKVLRPHFHFSCLNDGYYFLFPLFFFLFLLPLISPSPLDNHLYPSRISSLLGVREAKPHRPENPEKQPCFPPTPTAFPEYNQEIEKAGTST
jgi:hypothetical protein